MTLKVRLIPCLLLMNGRLVRSERFELHQVIGYPIQEVARFNEWAVDELIYIDISRDEGYDSGRDDHKQKSIGSALEILDVVSSNCFMPLTFGGRIRSLDDMRARFSRGADKITINTAAVDTPSMVEAGAQQFGSQAIVVSIDVRRHREEGSYEVFTAAGNRATGLDPVDWARQVEDLGAGEILLNSIDRDGTGEGYDLDLISSVSSAVTIPVVALGGVGVYEHLAPAVLDAGASAVAAANIFHFKELSDRQAKRALRRAGVDVRT